MKSVSLSVTMLFSVAILHCTEVNASTGSDYVSNSVATKISSKIENQNQISNLASKDNQNSNTNYQLSSGDFFIYSFYLFICLMLLLQVWLDYNFTRTQKRK